MTSARPFPYTSAVRAQAITPDDDDFLDPCLGLWVGTAGDLQVLMSADQDPVLFANVTVGWHPISVQKVFATGTTAQDIVAVR